MTTPVHRALKWAEIPPTDELLEQLDRYRRWLLTEAVTEGGIGPSEEERIETRHIADSLLFAGVWERQSQRPVLDVGTGVGLPGIPLALAHPERRFVLLDRSGRRIRLLRRAVRILGVENTEVVEADIDAFDSTDYTVVARASVPADALLGLTDPKNRPAEMVVGGSHRRRPVVPGFETVEIPSEILARPVWILRMVQ